MTPNEINRTISEWMGWTHLERLGILIADPPYRGYPPQNPIVGMKLPIPDYHSDLNAFHQAAMHLRNESPLKYIHYAATLMGLVAKFNSELDDRYSISAHDATAAQRCEALLRTLGLWKE